MFFSKKIIFITALTFLFFFPFLVQAEEVGYKERLLEIRRIIEQIKMNMSENPSYVTTLHPATDTKKAYLAGRVEELNKERGRVFLSGGQQER